MKYVRIFESMSLLVTLLSRVFGDIKNLAGLFVFIVLYFSFALFILGFQKGDEYYQINAVLANFLSMLRMSTGDHDFAMIAGLSEFEAYVYWGIWLVITLVFFLIFMNFIIEQVMGTSDSFGMGRTINSHFNHHLERHRLDDLTEMTGCSKRKLGFLLTHFGRCVQGSIVVQCIC
jgi:hypothetical protein